MEQVADSHRRRKSNTVKYILIAIISLAILAVIANKMGWIGKDKAIEVSTEKVVRRTIIETVSASGKVQPETEVKLSSEVSGEIVVLAVKEGDQVKKGQLVCKVRPDILQSGYNRAVASLNAQRAALAASQQQLKQAEANFKNTEARFRRSSELYKQKVLSAAEFDAAQAEYQSAKANLESLRQNIIGARFGVEQSQAVVKEAADNLSRTTIYSPVDGVVSKLSVELGERVVGTAQMAGTEIMRISNLNSMEVNVDVNESDINRVSIGDTAEIEVDAYQGKKFRGTVTEIASSANVEGASADQVTNFLVKIRILPESYENLAGASSRSPFKPGLSATVDIHTSKTSSLSVPIQSVTTREDQSATDSASECVFLYDKGKAKLVKVRTGIQDDKYIEIKEGLKSNQEVISGPFTAITKELKEGAAVEKVSKEKLFEGSKK